LMMMMMIYDGFWMFLMMFDDIWWHVGARAVGDLDLLICPTMRLDHLRWRMDG
jgi:hypothetical protein